MRMNAKEITYEEATLFGQPVLFTDFRLDRTTIPAQLYLYEIRHADDDSGLPCQVAKGILVNFYGSILSLEPLDIPADGYLDIDPKSLTFPDVIPTMTADRFLRTYERSIESA